MKIIIYSKSDCPQCETAKNILKAKGLEYKETILEDEYSRRMFYALCGPSVRQLPQVFIDGQRVGGVAGLQAALA